MRRPVQTLEDGRTPHFRFYHVGRGVYSVFAVYVDRDVFIGRIETASPLARSIDAGKWRMIPLSPKFDSMNEAAAALLDTAGEAIAAVKENKVA